MTDDHKTDPAPAPEDEPMHEKTDRELLEEICRRLEVGDKRFDRIERHMHQIDTDWTLAMNFLHSVSLERRRPDLAAQIEAAVDERRRARNGSSPDLRDEDTSPGDG